MSHQNSQAPDYLLRLVQQVKSTYIQPDLPRKLGRPRTYSGLSFLLVAVVAVTLRTFKGLALQRVFTQDARLRREIGWEKVPHRKTIETRLQSLQAEAETQVAALGQQIVSAIEPPKLLPLGSAIDGRMFAARGPKWHQKQRKKGILPGGLRNVDTASQWSKSGYRGWVQGHRLVLQTLLLPTPIPLFATWQANNLYEEQIALAALEKGDLAVTSFLLGDSSFGSPALANAYGKAGGWLLTPKQLPVIYKTWKQDLYGLRKETIELLFQRIVQVFDLKRCPTKGLQRNGAFVITAVWVYQVIAWNNYKQGKPIAEVKETVDLARWRVAI